MRRESTTLAAIATILVTLSPCANAAPAPEVIERGRKALADAGVTGDLRLTSSAPQQWPNSGLGCPQPRIQYLQVITAGHALRFADADGRTHTVNVAGDTAVVCSQQLDTSAAKNAAPAYRALDVQSLAETARGDLARRLGRPIGEVQLRDYDTVSWPNDTLSCAPALRERRAGVPGLKLFLSSGDELYTYHTDSTRAIPCPPIETQ